MAAHKSIASTGWATLATSMEEELADYDRWIEEVRAQLQAIPAGAPEATDMRQRGASMLAGLMRARDAIAAASRQVFDAQMETRKVIHKGGHA